MTKKEKLIEQAADILESQGFDFLEAYLTAKEATCEELKLIIEDGGL